MIFAHRSFYFRGEDSDILNDWLTHFMRDRYYAVCEERNAYMQMQTEMTGVLDSLSSQSKIAEQDKDTAEKQLTDAILAKQEALMVLQNLLVNMGVRTNTHNATFMSPIQTQQFPLFFVIAGGLQ